MAKIFEKKTLETKTIESLENNGRDGSLQVHLQGECKELILIDPQRLQNKDIRYILPGQRVLIEMNGPIVKALYRDGARKPFYKN